MFTTTYEYSDLIENVKQFANEFHQNILLNMKMISKDAGKYCFINNGVHIMLLKKSGKNIQYFFPG